MYIPLCVYIYMMEYYSAIKKKEILSFEADFDLKNSMLSEISQTEKDKYYMLSHMWELT